MGAFALVAFVEDVRYFGNPKKLVAYIGLNPSVNGSGEKESRPSLSRYGRTDLKKIFVEAAQTVLRTDTPMARRAKHLTAKGKPGNMAACALARKLAVLCWNVLMRHPAPDWERERAISGKLVLLASRVGKEAVRAAAYAVAVAAALQGHLPEGPRNGSTGQVIEKRRKARKEPLSA